MTNAADLNRTLFIADNLDVLRGIDSGSIDLIATDPPFNKGVTAFTGITKAGAEVSYKDVWTWSDVQQEWLDRIREDHPNLYAVIQAANTSHSEGMGAFLCWLGVRVLEMHRVLTPAGSLYLHCDHTASAYIRQMLDAVFGSGNFRNAVTWEKNDGRGKGSQHSPKQWGTQTDTILYYARSADVPLRPYLAIDEVDVPKQFPKIDTDGRRYKTGIPLWCQPSMGPRPNLCYEWRGYTNPHPSGWRLSKARLEEEYQKGNVVIRSDGKLERRKYLDEYEGIPIGDLWTDISPAKGQERTGYPTQKPLALYERIIKASSKPGDLVLDPFAGCATTCVAAERLGRRWIGIDINADASAVIRDRLSDTRQLLREVPPDIRILSDPPTRTDDGANAAPELVLVGQSPRAPRFTTRELRQRLIVADGLKCQGCGWVPHHADYLEVDHKVPKSREGRDDIRNRVLLCGPCNGAKSNKLTLAELRERRIEENRMADASWTRDWYQRTGRFG